ncbi:MAG: asparagine synthase-related protein [Acidobacteriota bacterium]
MTRSSPILLVTNQLAAFNNFDLCGAALGCHRHGCFLLADARIHYKSVDVLVRWRHRAGPDNGLLQERAITDLVPAEIINRPKQGFGVPIQQWIHQQLCERIRDTLNDP